MYIYTHTNIHYANIIDKKFTQSKITIKKIKNTIKNSCEKQKRC